MAGNIGKRLDIGSIGKFIHIEDGEADLAHEQAGQRRADEAGAAHHHDASGHSPHLWEKPEIRPELVAMGICLAALPLATADGGDT